MFLCPIRNTLMMNAQLTSGSPQSHSIHIKLNGFLAYFSTVSVMFLFWCVTTTTKVASISLTTRFCFAYFVLTRFFFTLWTFHNPYFTHCFRHSALVIILTDVNLFVGEEICLRGQEYMLALPRGIDGGAGG